jgi:hypothetical protein
MTNSLPGLWVMGERQGSDAALYQGAEFFPLSYQPTLVEFFLPLFLR